jgi:NarL family two-component system response regulator YdfI
MIRVLVVASSPVSQAGLENLLRGDASLLVVRVLADFAELSENVEELQPDVVLVEAGSADRGLPEEISALAEEAPVGIVLLVDDLNSDRDLEALRIGVRAVLPRNATPGSIIAAAHAASAGLVVLPLEGLASLMKETAPAQKTASAALIEPLTTREMEVLGMMAEGWGNKEISSRLGISEHTVKFHVAAIMGKLNAESRTEAVTLGIRHGLVML